MCDSDSELCKISYDDINLDHDTHAIVYNSMIEWLLVFNDILIHLEVRKSRSLFFLLTFNLHFFVLLFQVVNTSNF